MVSLLALPVPSCSPLVSSLADTPTTDIYTLPLHDALPICTALHNALSKIPDDHLSEEERQLKKANSRLPGITLLQDRKSTRLNSSHLVISYAVFCLKQDDPTLHPRDCFY